MLYRIAFIAIVGAVWAAIVEMIYASIRATLEKDERMEKMRYTLYAKKMADKMYREQMEQTEYRVNVPIVIHNDSDIKWRDDQ